MAGRGDLAAMRRQSERGGLQMNADRPPVLAHQRFVADRANFTGLSLAARFERIVRTNLWGAPTSVSGLGSENAATAAIKEALPGLLQRLEARSLLDAPCGDAGWIIDCVRGLDYTGVDIVPSLIAANRHRAARGEIAGRFVLADITRDSLPSADVIFCRDCLVHLSFDNIGRAIAQFRASGAQWLLTTTFPEWEANSDCEDGDWRALNLQRPPFDWPTPIELINERCEEGGGGWRDKSLGLWRLASVVA
jgi:Methyltransferase domain